MSDRTTRGNLVRRRARAMATAVAALVLSVMAILTLSPPGAEAAASMPTYMYVRDANELGQIHSLAPADSGSGNIAYCIEADKTTPGRSVRGTRYDWPGSGASQSDKVTRLYLDCAVWWAAGGVGGQYSSGTSDTLYDRMLMRNVIWAFTPSSWESSYPTGTDHLNHYNDGSEMPSDEAARTRAAYNWIKSEVDGAVSAGILTWGNDNPNWKKYPWYHCAEFYDMNGGYQDLVTCRTGRIRVRKSSANTSVTNGNSKYSLAGAKFGIYWDSSCSANTLYATITTDASGVAVSDYLPMWDFWVKEIDAPANYALNTSVTKVSVPYYLDGSNAYAYGEVSVAEQPVVGALDVKKVLSGSNQEPDRSFSFHVTIKNGSATWKSEDFTLKGGQTKSYSNIPLGCTYEVTETTPSGYGVSWSNRTGTITSGTKVTVTATNSRVTCDMQVKKVLSGASTADGYPVAGCSFGLWTTQAAAQAGAQSGSTFLGAKSTGADGSTGAWSGLGAGTYYVREISVPENSGLVLSGEIKSVTLAAGDSKVVEYANSVIGAEVTLTKRISDAFPAGGTFKFRLYQSDKSTAVGDEKVVSSSAQSVKWDGLAVNRTYYIRETYASWPAQVTNEWIQVKAQLSGGDGTLSGATYSISKVATDTETVGGLDLLKTDSTSGKPLGGVGFELCASQDVTDIFGNVRYRADQPIKMRMVAEGEYSPADDQSGEGSAEMLTSSAGKISVSGLRLRVDADTSFYWKETRGAGAMFRVAADTYPVTIAKGSTTGAVAHPSGANDGRTDVGNEEIGLRARIRKVDSDGRAVAGVRFDLVAVSDTEHWDGTKIHSAGDVIESVTTAVVDGESWATFSTDLYKGDYKVVEASAPRGVARTRNSAGTFDYPFSIDEETLSSDAVDASQGVPMLTVRTDEEGGAVVDKSVRVSLPVRKENAEAAGNGVTATFDLRAAHDIVAADGSTVYYRKDENVRTGIVTTGGETQVVDTDDEGRPIYIGTQQNGSATFYFVETAVSTPYVLDQTRHEVTVVDPGTEAEHGSSMPTVAATTVTTHRNQPLYGKANITKVDAEDGQPQDGAHYQVIALQDIVYEGQGGEGRDAARYPTTLTTEIEAGSVDAGTGEVTNAIRFVDSEGGEPYTDLVVTNGTIPEDKVPYLPIGTNADGTASSRYAFVEVKASAGHAIDYEMIPFTLTYDEGATNDDPPTDYSPTQRERPNLFRVQKVDMFDNPVAGTRVAFWRDEDDLRVEPKAGCDSLAIRTPDDTIRPRAYRKADGRGGATEATLTWSAGDHAWVADDLLADSSYQIEIGRDVVKVIETSEAGGATWMGRYAEAGAGWFAPFWVDQAAMPKDDSQFIQQDVLSGQAVSYGTTTGDDGTITARRLRPGDYVLAEVLPTSDATGSRGYLVDTEAHRFTVDEVTGFVSEAAGQGGAGLEITITDDKTKLSITKSTITDGGGEVPGASLTLTTDDHRVVDEWISTTADHVIEGLTPGWYRLTEHLNPKDYDKAESIRFNLLPTGEIQHVVMFDQPISIDAEIDKRQEIARPLDERDEANHDENNAAEQEDEEGRYAYSLDFRSNSNTWTDEFTVEDPLEPATDGMAHLESIVTPQAWQDYDGKMNVWYRTNKTDAAYRELAAGGDGEGDGAQQAEGDGVEGDPDPDTAATATNGRPKVRYAANATLSDGHANPWLYDDGAMVADGDGDCRVIAYDGWRLWKADVPTTVATKLEAKGLGLADGEYVTGFRFEYGRVEAGFTTRLDEWDRALLKDPHDDMGRITGTSSRTFQEAGAATDAAIARLAIITDGLAKGVGDAEIDEVLAGHEAERAAYEELLAAIKANNDELAAIAEAERDPSRSMMYAEEPTPGAPVPEDDDAQALDEAATRAKAALEAAMRLSGIEVDGMPAARDAIARALGSIQADVSDSIGESSAKRLDEAVAAYAAAVDGIPSDEGGADIDAATDEVIKALCAAVDDIRAVGLSGRVMYAPAVVHMVLTDAYVAGAELRNSAQVDAYRNGGNEDGRPTIGTRLMNKADGTHAVGASGLVTVVDEVTYTNLVPGREYVMSGELHVRENDSDAGALVDGGEPVAASATFTPTAPDGSVSLEFQFHAELLAGRSAVAFEECRIATGDEQGAPADASLLLTHKDIRDGWQTVNETGEVDIDEEEREGEGKLEGHDHDEVVQHARAREMTIGTRLATTAGTKVISSDGKAAITLIDTVDYHGLRPGHEYEIDGELHIRASGQDRGAVKGSAGKTRFKPEKPDGQVQVKLTIPANSGVIAPTVAYEELRKVVPETGKASDYVLAEHKNINDENQTVTVTDLASDLVKTGEGIVGFGAAAGMLASVAAAIARRRRNEA